MSPMNQASFAVDALWSSRPKAEHRLKIHTGRAWVTLNGTMDTHNPDFVLFTGDDMRVQAGQHVVVEAWPQHPGEILSVSWQICLTAYEPEGEQQLVKQAA